MRRWIQHGFGGGVRHLNKSTKNYVMEMSRRRHGSSLDRLLFETFTQWGHYAAVAVGSCSELCDSIVFPQGISFLCATMMRCLQSYFLRNRQTNRRQHRVGEPQDDVTVTKEMDINSVDFHTADNGPNLILILVWMAACSGFCWTPLRIIWMSGISRFGGQTRRLSIYVWLWVICWRAVFFEFGLQMI